MLIKDPPHKIIPPGTPMNKRTMYGYIPRGASDPPITRELRGTFRNVGGTAEMTGSLITGKYSYLISSAKTDAMQHATNKISSFMLVTGGT